MQATNRPRVNTPGGVHGFETVRKLMHVNILALIKRFVGALGVGARSKDLFGQYALHRQRVSTLNPDLASER